MNDATAARLLALNHDFYEKFGASFSATRQRLQPGVKRILETLKGDESILDLGCGNGELARVLAERGQRGPYLGLDFSLALLREAESQPEESSTKFLQIDITSANWAQNLQPFDRLRVAPSTLRQAQGGAFNLITAFAVLHHIPGEELRLKILKKIPALLAGNGRFIISNWQFLNSARLKARIQPWSAAGLSDADVDEGDYLLDWRDGGKGLRYVHQFSAQELSGLAEQAGLRVSESFLSDGETGNLGLYQIWV
jgi:tRNA (uracil-5-)-methyltransferase TRM9